MMQSSRGPDRGADGYKCNVSLTMADWYPTRLKFFPCPHGRQALPVPFSTKVDLWSNNYPLISLSGWLWKFRCLDKVGQPFEAFPNSGAWLFLKVGPILRPSWKNEFWHDWGEKNFEIQNILDGKFFENCCPNFRDAWVPQGHVDPAVRWFQWSRFDHVSASEWLYSQLSGVNHNDWQGVRFWSVFRVSRDVSLAAFSFFHHWRLVIPLSLYKIKLTTISFRWNATYLLEAWLRRCCPSNSL